jgi:uncharacterized coiled-coil DUF342 family protein
LTESAGENLSEFPAIAKLAHEIAGLRAELEAAVKAFEAISDEVNRLRALTKQVDDEFYYVYSSIDKAKTALDMLRSKR